MKPASVPSRAGFVHELRNYIVRSSPRGVESGSRAGINGGVMNELLKLWGVRYQVQDVARSIEFYTRKLGFHLDLQNLPAFGQVSLDGLKLILSGPGASGSRAMPDGRHQ